MTLRLKDRIVLSFIAVIVTTSLFSTYVGIRLISKSIVPRVRSEVRVHLNTAHEIFQSTITDVSDVIRLTANRFFINDALAAGNLTQIRQELQNVRRRENLRHTQSCRLDGHGAPLSRRSQPDRRRSNVKSNSQQSAIRPGSGGFRGDTVERRAS